MEAEGDTESVKAGRGGGRPRGARGRGWDRWRRGLLGCCSPKGSSPTCQHTLPQHVLSPPNTLSLSHTISLSYTPHHGVPVTHPVPVTRCPSHSVPIIHNVSFTYTVPLMHTVPVHTVSPSHTLSPSHTVSPSQGYCHILSLSQCPCHTQCPLPSPSFIRDRTGSLVGGKGKVRVSVSLPASPAGWPPSPCPVSLQVWEVPAGSQAGLPAPSPTSGPSPVGRHQGRPRTPRSEVSKEEGALCGHWVI